VLRSSSACATTRHIRQLCHHLRPGAGRVHSRTWPGALDPPTHPHNYLARGRREQGSNWGAGAGPGLPSLPTPRALAQPRGEYAGASSSAGRVLARLDGNDWSKSSTATIGEHR